MTVQLNLNCYLDFYQVIRKIGNPNDVNSQYGHANYLIWVLRCTVFVFCVLQGKLYKIIFFEFLNCFWPVIPELNSVIFHLIISNMRLNFHRFNHNIFGCFIYYQHRYVKRAEELWVQNVFAVLSLAECLENKAHSGK